MGSLCVSLCRWFDEDTPDPAAIKLADIILRAGMQQIPNNPYMILLYSSFLIDVQGSYQSGYGQLQAAKKAEPRRVVPLGLCIASLPCLSPLEFMGLLLIYVCGSQIDAASSRALPFSAESRSTHRRRVGRRTATGHPTWSATSSSRRTTGADCGGGACIVCACFDAVFGARVR